MTTFANLPVSSFLDALASSEPTPGGGTAAAVAGAMGASLLMMVAGLARSRNNTDEERAALAAARTGAAALQSQLLVLADDDAAAFDEVMATFKLPKGTDEEKAARSAAIQAAYRSATEVPLATLRAAVATLAHAETVAAGGNRSAASDVGVAVGLLQAAAEGAAANVQINLGSLKDRDLAAKIEAELSTLSEAAARHTATARASLA